MRGQSSIATAFVALGRVVGCGGTNEHNTGLEPHVSPDVNGVAPEVNGVAPGMVDVVEEVDEVDATQVDGGSSVQALPVPAQEPVLVARLHRDATERREGGLRREHV